MRKLNEPVVYTAGGDLSKEWHVEIYFLHPETGVRTRKRSTRGINEHTTKAARMKAARDVAVDLLRLLAEGRAPKKKRYKMASLSEVKGRCDGESSLIHALHCAIDRKRNLDRRPRTISTYTNRVGRLEKFLIETKRERVAVCGFTDGMVYEFFSWMRNSFYSKQKCISMLAVLWNELVKMRVAVGNPFKCIEIIEADGKTLLPFTREEISTLRRALHKEDLQVYVASLLVCDAMLRTTSELRNIRLWDFDFENRKLTIHFEQGKNRRTRRVDLSRRTVNWLRQMKVHLLPGHLYLFGAGGVPGEAALKRDALTARHNKIMESVGIDRANHSLYGWKYTGNAILMQRGVNIVKLKEQNRHRDIRTTYGYLRRYNVFDKSNVWD